MTRATVADPVVACYGEGPRVPLTVRIGATGHRPHRLPADLEPLKRAIARLVADIRGIAIALDAAPGVRLLYAEDAAAPKTRIISALAEGSDRLVAQAALVQGCELMALLPFEQAAYERDFAPGCSVDDPERGTIAAFRTLLAQAAAVVALDGHDTSDEARKRAYRRAGQLAVSHSDVLIAVWDGGPAQGIGGTEEIVQHACLNGVPIIHIDPRAPEASRLLTPPDQMAGDGGSPVAVPYTKAALYAFLEERFLPGEIVTRCAAQLRDFAHEPGFSIEPSTLPDFIHQGPLVHHGRLGWFARSFIVLRDSVVPPALVGAKRAHPPPQKQPAPTEPGALPLHRLFAAFLRADLLALHYSQLTRSTFVAIYLFGAIAVGCAAASLTYGHLMLIEAWHAKAKDLLTLIELLVLGIIGVLVLADRRLRWHYKWLDYRLLAELLRPMPYLAAVAATVPTETVRHGALQRLDRRGRIEGSGAKPESMVGAWVFAQFEAVMRHAGIPGATQDAAYLDRCRRFAAANLLADQVHYHEGTAIRNAGLDHRLVVASTVLFVATLAVVAAKLGLRFGGIEATWLGFLATFMPAAAAACYGIRSHAELEIVARRSEDMARELERIRRGLESLSGPALSSEAISASVRRAADVMVRDAVGWLDIFEAKEPEPA